MITHIRVDWGRFLLICTFFGHRDCGETIFPTLCNAIESLISQGVSCFYVGNHGNFDALCLRALREAKKKHPTMSYCVVLSALPSAHTATNTDPTLVPDGIETVPKRFAILHRNRWLLENADIVIGYVNRSFGGAARFFGQAQRVGKRVINLALEQP